eukprot:m.368796 g.368796  ORF g.368796 m.368796 type:complete len:202 (-) comp16669_c0_seq2:60-665(-)
MQKRKPVAVAVHRRRVAIAVANLAATKAGSAQERITLYVGPNKFFVVPPPWVFVCVCVRVWRQCRRGCATARKYGRWVTCPSRSVCRLQFVSMSGVFSGQCRTSFRECAIIACATGYVRFSLGNFGVVRVDGRAWPALLGPGQTAVHLGCLSVVRLWAWPLFANTGVAFLTVSDALVRGKDFDELCNEVVSLPLPFRSWAG